MDEHVSIFISALLGHINTVNVVRDAKKDDGNEVIDVDQEEEEEDSVGENDPSRDVGEESAESESESASEGL